MVFTFAEPMPPPKRLTRGEVEKKTAALKERVSKVSMMPRSEADALDLSDREIGIAYGTSRSQRELIKVPEGAQLSSKDIELAAWINAYAVLKAVSFRDSMSRIFDFLKRRPDYLKEFLGTDINFSESAVFAFEDELQEHKALRIAQRLHIYQAAAGCSFVEAIGAGILELDGVEVSR